jgi:hypothetical protein
LRDRAQRRIAGGGVKRSPPRSWGRRLPAKTQRLKRAAALASRCRNDTAISRERGICLRFEKYV